MGAAAARRACDLFAPEVVMAAHEDLFGVRALSPKGAVEAHCTRPVSPQLDPVRVFARFASHSSSSISPSATCMQALPAPVRKQRAALWGILEQSLPVSERSRLESDLVCKHQQHKFVGQVSSP